MAPRKRLPDTARGLALIAALMGPACVAAGEVSRGDYVRAVQGTAVAPDVLRAVVIAESNERPYALNINGSPAYCETRSEATRGLRYVLERPWRLRLARGRVDAVYDLTGDRVHCVLRGPNHDRAWFRSSAAARDFAARHGVDAAPERIRRASVDIGLGQINWYYHGPKISHSGALLDPQANLVYAAEILDGLLERHSLAEAIGRYHGGSSAGREAYAERVMRIRRNLDGRGRLASSR